MTFKNLPDQPRVEAFLKDGRVVDGDIPGAERQKLERWSIGALKGFAMCLQGLAMQNPPYKPEFRDILKITCTGYQKSSDPEMDDMLMFDIEPTRM